MVRIGTRSRSPMRSSVSARPCGSMKPMTTSSPCRFSSCASPSIWYDLPTPGAAPMYTRSRARPSSLARASSDSAAEGGVSGIRRRLLLHRMLRVEREVHLEHIDDRLAEESELASCSVCLHDLPDLLL